MVIGLEKFAEYFKDYPNSYVIIGGTACDIIIGDAGFKARATKDIDIILVVEALDTDFVKQFWQFIKDGNYERKEKSADERKYYRFLKPEKEDFPFQLELFSRKPDVIELEEGQHLTPIPVDDDLSSLSAILLSDDYYGYMIDHSTSQNGLQRANPESLIVLKAKAYLEIAERIANGIKEDNKKLRKHKADVFRLAVMLKENEEFELPESIKSHFQTFVTEVENDLPGNEMYKEMGLNNIDSGNVFKQLLKNFKLNI